MKIQKSTGVIIFFVIIIGAISWNRLGSLLSPGDYHDVDHMVKTIMDKSAAPGIAMVISEQGKLDYKCYGYGDIKSQKPVSEEALFELGSTTKAFTALAVILLEDRGDLKGSDCVSDYFPWFTPVYNGKQADITIDQLLAHTGGIPAWSIRLIPEGTTEDMLEKTIRNISSITLDTYPGTKYNYATVNYDVLALIIEKVTGQRYEDYIKKDILLPLGMTESYFSTGQEKPLRNLTRGYKIFFGKNLEYEAPRYKGNIAAGYLVTNIKELGLWVNAQLGIGNIPDKLASAIKKSHEVIKETAGYEGGGKYYSYGWSNNVEDRVITHGGNNPNYSSHVIIDLEKEEAIFVLANLSSGIPAQIAHNVYEDINGKQMRKYSYDDFYLLLDLIFSVLVIIEASNLCIKIARRKKQTVKTENPKSRSIMGIKVRLGLRIVLIIFIIVWPYFINYSYHLLWIWMSNIIFVWEALAIINGVRAIAENIKRIKVSTP